MYLSKICVKNYKSFRDSGDIEFKPGINIIVGQNNAGKTALLESLSLKFDSKPHKNPKDVYGNRFWRKFDEDSEKRLSEVNVSIIRTSEEIFSLIGETILLPELTELGQNGRRPIGIDKYKERLLKPLEIRFYHDGLNSNEAKTSSSLGNYSEAKEKVLTYIHIKENKRIEYSRKDNSQRNNVFSIGSCRLFSSRIYKFSAERKCESSCIVAFNQGLKTNAENLAEVLSNTLTKNKPKYEKLIKYVSEVIPSVKWISTIKTQSQEGKMGNWEEIRVWTAEQSENQGWEDLSVSLSECGTGIGQVLAILYVVVTSKEPRTIIIDEPNSFLHPSAAKKLIQILNKKEFSHHQYFISTHSPEILSTAKASTITMLKYEDGETKVEAINPTQTNDLRKTLDEIGVRFSDVFFAENILWVEGPTEEKAFPLILEKADKILDVTILPLVHTDDFREKKKAGKHAKLAFEIYKRLSEGNALTPPFVAVILDKEDASEQELKELEKLGEGKLKFIPQRMYENYLIDFPAITEVLNEEILEESEKVSVKQVEEWVEEKRQAMFLSKKDTGKEVLDFSDWLKQVHAAELLESLFSELSNKTVEYRKTTHSVELTKWLLENKPEQLKELQDYFVNIIEAG